MRKKAKGFGVLTVNTGKSDKSLLKFSTQVGYFICLIIFSSVPGNEMYRGWERESGRKMNNFFRVPFGFFKIHSTFAVPYRNKEA